METLLRQGYSFQTLGGSTINSKDSSILRHDVDLYPGRSLLIARIENELGLKGSYYFRNVKESWDEEVITKIADLGHDVGYHYEDLSFAEAKLKAQGVGHRAKGRELEKMIVTEGIESFAKSLERLRKLVPVSSICMHGSPLSRWDSRLLWKYYDYRDFGIVVEPYFDLNMEEMLYLTDTGRRWNGTSVSVRDKAWGTELRAQRGISGQRVWVANRFIDWKVKPVEGSLMNMTNKALTFQAKYNFRSTNDIIHAAEGGGTPGKIMMTFHPQRWTDKPIPWVKELVWQNVKNVGKYFLVWRQALGRRL